MPNQRAGALALYALALGAFLMAAAALAPLYGVYARDWGLSPVVVTAVFAIYALFLLATLLTVGSISDRHGRRPVLAAALALQVVALVLFLAARSVEWLFAARIVQGVATGVATSTIAAGLIDADPRRGPLFNAVTPLAGMAIGAVLAGALVAYAPWPHHLVFVVLIAVTAAALAGIGFIPETNVARSPVPHSFRPRIKVPAAAVRALVAMTPLTVALWGLGGFCLSLLPAVVAEATGAANPLVGAAVVALVNGAGAVGVVALRARSTEALIGIGTGALVVGLVLVVGGIAAGSTATLLVGAIPAGIGFGVSFLGSVRTITPLVGPSERAQLMAAYFVISYLSFSVPALAAGFLAREVGVVATAEVYGAAILLLTVLGRLTIAAMRPLVPVGAA